MLSQGGLIARWMEGTRVSIIEFFHSKSCSVTQLVRCILGDMCFRTGVLTDGAMTKALKLLPLTVELGASAGGIDDDDGVRETDQEE